ncbi:MAG: Crp/Fnr family transcriptional regulator [Bacteroidales bacterium]|nr:Crp/Fnr family transcriptional regulator [Bacteroidales bacterium]
MKDIEKNKTCWECTHKCFNSLLSEKEYNELVNNCTEVQYHHGEVIVKQGGFVSQIFYVNKGFVKVVIEGKNDRNTILKIVTKDNFIAFPVLGNQKVYPFSLVAVGNTSLCQLRIDYLKERIYENPKLLNFIIEWISHDYLYVYNRINVMSTRNNHGKLAAALHYLSNGDLKDSRIFSLITRKELAELATISIESVNKIINELKHDGIIQLDKKDIRIVRPELIIKLSTVG